MLNRPCDVCLENATKKIDDNYYCDDCYEKSDPAKKGKVISEDQLFKRIRNEVESRLGDVVASVELHNFLFKAQISVHENEAGEPVDMAGKPGTESEAWSYVFHQVSN